VSSISVCPAHGADRLIDAPMRHSLRVLRLGRSASSALKVARGRLFHCGTPARSVPVISTIRRQPSVPIANSSQHLLPNNDFHPVSRHDRSNRNHHAAARTFPQARFL
jgi:hypothetical protein